jgi:hypothetical protein
MLWVIMRANNLLYVHTPRMTVYILEEARYTTLGIRATLFPGVLHTP